MRAPRVDTQQVDLDGFESWLRGQLAGPAFAAVVTVVLQMIRALFTQNTQLRVRLQGRRPKPPSERFAVLDRQLAFAFMVPTNDVTPAAGTPTPGSAPSGEPEKKPRAKPTPRGPIPKGLPVIDVPNNVPDALRVCGSCCVPMTTVRHRPVSTIEMIPGRIVVHRRLDEILACPHCDAIVCAKAPPSVLDGGRLGPTLVTEALCSKVLMECPWSVRPAPSSVRARPWRRARWGAPSRACSRCSCRSPSACSCASRRASACSSTRRGFACSRVRPGGHIKFGVETSRGGRCDLPATGADAR